MKRTRVIISLLPALILLLSALPMTAYAADTDLAAVSSSYLSEARCTVTEPKAGDTPASMSVSSSEPSKYSAAIDYWYYVTISGAHITKHTMTSTSVFEAGKTYYVMVKITPGSGYYGDDNTKIYINGTEQEVSIEGTGLTARKSFKVSEAADTLLSEVFVTVTEPALGATPASMSVTSSAPDKYSAVIDYWYYTTADGEVRMTSTSAFEAGKTYSVWVRITPKSGYYVNSSTKTIINYYQKQTILTPGTTVGEPDYIRAKTGFSPFPAPVSEVRVTVTEPKAGDTPASLSASSSEPDKYTAAIEYWYCYTADGETRLSSTSKFEAKQNYFAMVRITPMSGYYIRFKNGQAAGSDAKIFINNEETDLIVPSSTSAGQTDYVEATKAFWISASGTSRLLGDADGDNVVSVIDATTIQKVRASIAVSSFIEEAADVDGDNVVSVIDATIIQKFLAHIPVPYKIGEPIS